MKYIPCDLFGEALTRRNGKQTCADRVIADCYEKIRSGKQEKPFHEVILQIGNRYDMAADSLDGELARAVLHEYMGSFLQGNQNMQSVLHPSHGRDHSASEHRLRAVTTGSKQGLGTRVFLKQGPCRTGLHRRHVGRKSNETSG